MDYPRDENILDLDENVFVSNIAAAIYSRRFDNSISFEDYKQYGLLGYLEAKKKYNPDLGHSFKAFAAYRVKGAILNGIVKYTEKLDYYSYKKRSINQKVNRLTEKESEVSFSYFANTVVELVIDDMLDSVFAELVVNPENNSLSNSSKVSQNLLQIVKQLPEKQRQVITYYYYSDLSFQEIASVLNLSKGRVSQLHKSALKALCEEIAEYDDYLAYL